MEISAPKEMINVRPLSDSNDIRRLSALMNAAKISPLISERTLGLNPDATDLAVNSLKQNGHCDENNENIDHHPNVNHKNQNNNNNDNITDQHKSPAVQPAAKTPPRFRTDVWREVSLNDECNPTTASIFHLNDCKAISFRIAMSNAEKQRRAKVQSTVNRKVIDIDTELESRLRQIRIESAEQAQKRLQEKRQQREQVLNDAIKQMDENALKSEEASRREMNEMIEHNRKIIDRANKMKHDEEIRGLIESIYACKSLFIGRFEAYVKSLLAGQSALELIDKKGTFLKCYEKIMTVVNARQSTRNELRNELDAFEQLCEEIKQESIRIDAEMVAFKESINAASVAAAKAAEALAADRRERAEAAALAARAAATEAAQQQVQNSVGATDAVDATQLNAPITINDFVNPKRYKEYQELMYFLNESNASIRPLIDDTNYKSFRFNLQKALSTPVNAITAVSAAHLKDKFDRIVQLLSGQRVPDFQISAADHPCGIQYCTLLLAKKIVGQAEDSLSSTLNQQATYAYAAIIVAIWQLFPNFGKLFLAVLYKGCPYLVPYFIPQVDDQTTEDYSRLLGYKYINNKIEPQDQYLKRITGLQRLYSAILITQLRNAQQNQPHPQGIENGWIWLTNFLNLDPMPDICPTLLLEFLEVAGSEMWKVYGVQFQKLLTVLHKQYVPRLEKVDAGGPKCRLEGLINDILKNGQIAKPSGALPLNFW